MRHLRGEGWGGGGGGERGVYSTAAQVIQSLEMLRLADVCAQVVHAAEAESWRLQAFSSPWRS